MRSSEVEGDASARTADRAGLVRAQTPQGARRELLAARSSAAAGRTVAFADEAELLARHGVPVVTVPGEPANLKVTEPADLELVARWQATRPARSGSAWAWTAIPSVPLDGLRLAGIEIPEAPRLHGHSDGDVALHALCDALLGAAGMGDLGRLFPAGDPATRGIDSRPLVQAVLERIADAGCGAVSADVTIVGARPRLGGGATRPHAACDRSAHASCRRRRCR